MHGRFVAPGCFSHPPGVTACCQAILGLILAFQTLLFCQFPQTKTLIGVSLSRFSPKNTSLSCYSANHVVFKCSLETICATKHAWQIDRQTVDQTEAKQLRQCQGILEDSATGSGPVNRPARKKVVGKLFWASSVICCSHRSRTTMMSSSSLTTRSRSNKGHDASKKQCVSILRRNAKHCKVNRNKPSSQLNRLQVADPQ